MGREPLTGERLEALLERLPDAPGVYQMQGASGELLYVGKAKSLKSRVKSYFRASGDTRAFIPWLSELLFDLEVIVTPSERDALLLERDLIGRLRPRFNVNLRDDKSFLVIHLSDHAYPRLSVARHRERQRGKGSLDERTGRWFGPYTSSAAARGTVRAVQQAFGLRVCTDQVFARRDRPCLLYDMRRCLGPCALAAGQARYAERVGGAIRFLRGDIEGILDDLRSRMQAAAEALRYEEAAALRDRLRAVETALRDRPLLRDRAEDLDALGFHREGASGVFALLSVRAGRWHSASTHFIEKLQSPSDDAIRQLVMQRYAPGADIPPTLLLPAETGDELGPLGEWLAEQRGGPVRVWVPQRGEPERLLEMAQATAAQAFQARLATSRTLQERLERLSKRLGLKELPRRIECFDLSTLQGRESVGAMAVLLDGEPAPSAYRRYRIREAKPDSDVDMMREVIGRRLRRLAESPAPDLIVLDGGLGQLNAIQALLQDLGIEGVGLAAVTKSGPGAGRHKADLDRVFVAGQKNAIRLRPSSDELFLLSRVRDEAHRFAIAYHRKLRQKSVRRSAFEALPGVGPALARRLRKQFETLEALRAASPEALAAVPGIGPERARRLAAALTATTLSEET